MPFSTPRPSATHHRQGLRLAFGLVAALVSGTSAAAGVNGIAVGADGIPLARVPVCLKASLTQDDCSKLRYTDKAGAFSFRGLKADGAYVVEVYQDRTASARRLDGYRTYVWEPAAQTVELTDRWAEASLPPFVGKFNFSNFQRVLRFTAADFPELSEFDLAGEYVVLKLSYAASDPVSPPETIFLAQVTSAERILLEASVPAATIAIDYEIYTVGRSLKGRIVLADG